MSVFTRMYIGNTSWVSSYKRTLSSQSDISLFLKQPRDKDVISLHLVNALKAQTMARLENAIVSLVELFNEYADDGHITLDDFKTMLADEISCKELKDYITDEALEECLEELDRNQDGLINIREFSRGVAFCVKCLYKVDKRFKL